MKTYDQLMQEYEKISLNYLALKSGTKAKELMGKRLDKVCEALEQWRTDNKPLDYIE